MTRKDARRKMQKAIQLPAMDDPRSLPSYGLAEASHYIQIPLATLRSWVKGRFYQTDSARKFFAPLITLPHKQQPALSFFNLVEAHVLDAIRRQHKVALYKVRKALDYLHEHFPSAHPLADQSFETDGLTLFVQKYGQLIDVGDNGQIAIRKLLEAHLKRIERDDAGVAVRLYPFTQERKPESPRIVVIDPFVAFGRAAIRGTGIPTAVVAERYKCGESVDQLAEDYGRSRVEIEEAIRCELPLEAA